VIESPVLLIAFNRPDFASKATELIVEQRPPLLYVACDGPRTADESSIVDATRGSILAVSNGHVEIRTLFQDRNLGCKRGVESAITWFLSHEPEGIIVEDDCLPRPEFFYFADRLLDRYRDDPVVMHIGGYCHTPTHRQGYRYSRFPAVWGWATWRRAWSHYPTELPEMTASRRRALRGAFASSGELDFFADKWAAVREGTLDTWDFSWCYALMSCRGLAVQPCQNLVRNIGVGDPRAAHTTRKRSGAFERSTSPDLAYLLDGPEFRVPDFDFDRRYFKTSVAGRLHRVRRLVRDSKNYLRGR
jgi:hypothetical protein